MVVQDQFCGKRGSCPASWRSKHACFSPACSAGEGGPVAEGGSVHLAAPGSIPGVSTQPTRLGVQGCGGVHSTLTAGIIHVKAPLVVSCILRFATLGRTRGAGLWRSTFDAHGRDHSCESPPCGYLHLKICHFGTSAQQLQRLML